MVIYELEKWAVKVKVHFSLCIVKRPSLKAYGVEVMWLHTLFPCYKREVNGQLQASRFTPRVRAPRCPYGSRLAALERRFKKYSLVPPGNRAQISHLCGK